MIKFQTVRPLLKKTWWQ